MSIAWNSIAYLRREVTCIEPNNKQICAPNNSDLNPVDHAIWGHVGASLSRQEVWHRWSVEAGDRAGVSHYGPRFIDHNITWDNGNVVCSVSWIKMAVTLNIRFTNCLYYKIVVVTDVLLKYFLKYGLQHYFFLKIISLDQTSWYTWRPLASSAFIEIKVASATCCIM